MGLINDSDIRLFTYSLMNYCFSWLGIKPFAIDSLGKSRNNRIMGVNLGSTYAVELSLPNSNTFHTKLNIDKVQKIP